MLFEDEVKVWMFVDDEGISTGTFDGWEKYLPPQDNALTVEGMMKVIKRIKRIEYIEEKDVSL